MEQGISLSRSLHLVSLGTTLVAWQPRRQEAHPSVASKRHTVHILVSQLHCLSAAEVENPLRRLHHRLLPVAPNPKHPTKKSTMVRLPFGFRSPQIPLPVLVKSARRKSQQITTQRHTVAQDSSSVHLLPDTPSSHSTRPCDSRIYPRIIKLPRHQH